MDDYQSISRDQCARVIEDLLGIFKKILPHRLASFLVYGTFLGQWRPGLSDLDSMLYFKGSFLDISKVILSGELQSGLKELYQEFPFLGDGNFFSDVFIMDELHGHDGRFMVHDADSFNMFFIPFPERYRIMHGYDFLSELKPMSLRNQDELYLSGGLQMIRNYLLFELPKPIGGDSSFAQKESVKLFRVLPRIVSKIVEEPRDPIPEGIALLEVRFPEIDYRPLRQLWETSREYYSQKRFFETMHDAGKQLFLDCWLCYEETLAQLVKKSPAKSKH